MKNDFAPTSRAIEKLVAGSADATACGEYGCWGREGSRVPGDGDVECKTNSCC